MSIPSSSYTPLQEKSEIRLLNLQPGSQSDPIRCTLIHAKLSENLQYEALSYMWGPETVLKGVEIDGKVRQVRENLWLALKYLRLRGVERVLWVDAVCINQSDDIERSHQVYQMGTIYRCAKSVVVWLGQPDSSSYRTLLLLREKPSGADVRARLLNNPLRWDDVAQLCNREYWKRLWIIQELVLATHIVVHCGDLFIQWEIFEGALCAFRDEFSAILVESNLEIRLRANFLFCKTIVDSVPLKICQQRRQKIEDRLDRNMSILSLVRIYKDANCADVRDKIFGLHSLAPMCCRTMIPVDYACSVYILCRRVLGHHLLSHASETTPQIFLLFGGLHKCMERGNLKQKESQNTFEFRGSENVENRHGSEANVKVEGFLLGHIISTTSSFASLPWKEKELLMRVRLRRSVAPEVVNTVQEAIEITASSHTTGSFDDKAYIHTSAFPSYASVATQVELRLNQDCERQLPIESYLSQHDDAVYPGDPRLPDLVCATLEAMERTGPKDCLIYFRNEGIMGFAPGQTEPGDVICAFEDQDVIAIMRHAEGGYHVIGRGVEITMRVATEREPERLIGSRKTGHTFSLDLGILQFLCEKSRSQRDINYEAMSMSITRFDAWFL